MKLVKMIRTLVVTTEGDYQINDVCEDVTTVMVSIVSTAVNLGHMYPSIKRSELYEIA